jgi:hypothetical protein
MNKGEYAYVKCNNVTTIWINGQGFSFLTKYSNDQNYFFLPLTESGFSLMNWNEGLTKNKVSRPKMEQFAIEVNNQGKVAQNLEKAKSEVRKTICIFTSLGVFFLALFVLCFVLWIGYLGNYRTNILVSKLLVYLWAFLLVCGISLLIFCCKAMTKTYKEYAVSKQMIGNNLAMESMISRWNNEYFLPNGLYVMAPRNLAYLHFVLDSSLTFMMENHPYPYDLAKKK